MNLLVTGSNGFLGRHFVEQLRNAGHDVHKAPRSFDLERFGDALDLFERVKNGSHPVTTVIHCAGYNGGIAFNKAFPADVFYRNTVMGLNVMRAAQRTGLKLVNIITSCAYPDEEILEEEKFWDGLPHESIRCHGLAKRNSLSAQHYFHQQYGVDAITICPNTIYGPGDTLDPIKTKVMMALIKKFENARQENLTEVTCWGTGSPKREFIYVEDVVWLTMRAIAVYDDHRLPLNLSSGQEHSIRELSELIAKAVGYEGKIVWDTNKPDGQARKKLDTSRMRSILGDFKFTSLEEGVEKTIRWYRNRGE